MESRARRVLPANTPVCRDHPPPRRRSGSAAASAATGLATPSTWSDETPSRSSPARTRPSTAGRTSTASTASASDRPLRVCNTITEAICSAGTDGGNYLIADRSGTRPGAGFYLHRRLDSRSPHRLAAPAPPAGLAVACWRRRSVERRPPRSRRSMSSGAPRLGRAGAPHAASSTVFAYAWPWSIVLPLALLVRAAGRDIPRRWPSNAPSPGSPRTAAWPATTNATRPCPRP